MEPRHFQAAAADLEEFIEGLGDEGYDDRPQAEWLRLRPGMLNAVTYLRDWGENLEYEQAEDAQYRRELLAAEAGDVQRHQKLAAAYWDSPIRALIEEHNLHVGSGGWVVAEHRNSRDPSAGSPISPSWPLRTPSRPPIASSSRSASSRSGVRTFCTTSERRSCRGPSPSSAWNWRTWPGSGSAQSSRP